MDKRLGKWTPERLTFLREKVEEGWSSRMIAVEMGITRNAIIGKMLRHKIKSRNPSGSAPSATRKGIAQRKRRQQLKDSNAPRHKSGPPPVFEPPPKYELSEEKLVRKVVGSVVTFVSARERNYVSNAGDSPVEQRRTVLTARSCDCRWPIGDPKDADFAFCGAPIAHPKVSYCRFHMKRAYNRS